MKNFLIYSLLVCLFFSCGNKSKEDKIKVAFKDYVNINFDNPKNLKDITSIYNIDSISTIELKRILSESLEECIELDNLEDSLKQRYTTLIDSLPYGYVAKQRGSEVVQRAMFSNFSLIRHKMDGILDGSLTELKIPATISDYPDTLIYTYEIKYRIIKDGEPVMETIYANTNKSLSIIEFCENNDIDNEDLKSFMHEMNDIMSKWNKRSEITSEEIKNDRIIIDFIESSLSSN